MEYGREEMVEATGNDELEFFEIEVSWDDIHADMQDIDYSLSFDKRASVEAWTGEMASQLEEWGYTINEKRTMAALPGVSPFDQTDTTIDDDLTRAAQIVAGRGTYFRYLPESPAYALPSLRCQRCGHTWTPRSASKPKQCPHCKQTGWDHPARSR
jgi:rubrerythrin